MRTRDEKRKTKNGKIKDEGDKHLLHPSAFRLPPSPFRLPPSSFILLLLLLALLSPAAMAQNQSSGLRFWVEHGFDGYVKDSLWTPIRITASNTGEAATGEIRIITQYPGEHYVRRLTLPSQSQKEITLLVPLRGGEYTLEFVNDAGKTLYRRRQSAQILPRETYLVGVIAPQPELLNFLAGLSSRQSGYQVEVAHLSLDELPERAVALDALDALIFNDVDATQLTPAQQNALARWVKQGGKLIAGGGPNAAATIAGLSLLLPVERVEIKTLDALVDLGNWVNEPVPEQGPYLAGVPQPAPNASVDLYEQGDPFLLSAPLGRGQVIYFALDFSLAPMNGWAGNEAFWKRLLNPLEASPPFYANYNAPRAINNALADIPGAGLPSPWAFLAYLCAYFFVLIPVNYLFLRIVKRPQWAWITIPALIVLFTLLGYISGFRARGGRVILRQISITQQVSGDDTAAVETFIGLYSPSRARYTLRFEGDALPQPTDGGSGYKGVKTTSSAPTTIRFDDRNELQNLWTDIGSMATAMAHDEITAQPIELDLHLKPEGSGWRISGRIINHTGQTLTDAGLLAGDYGLELSTLKPGLTEVDQRMRQVDAAPYSDVIIWGNKSYYQLDDTEAQMRDQIVRSIFFDNYAASYPSNALGRGQLQDTVFLIGWQGEESPTVDFEVLDHSISREAFGLRIIAAPIARD